jgi:hypothetical protein
MAAARSGRRTEPPASVGLTRYESGVRRRQQRWSSKGTGEKCSGSSGAGVNWVRTGPVATRNVPPRGASPALDRSPPSPPQPLRPRARQPPSPGGRHAHQDEPCFSAIWSKAGVPVKLACEKVNLATRLETTFAEPSKT